MALLVGLVLGAALLLLLFVAGRGFRGPGDKARARLAEDGVQELEITVRGRFQPSIVVVRKGIPARLIFDRQEDDPCSAQVIFSGSRQERWLAPFTTTPVQFTPGQPGRYLFTCSFGMYQGWLVVEE